MGVMKYLLFVLFPANGDAQYRVFSEFLLCEDGLLGKIGYY